MLAFVVGEEAQLANGAAVAFGQVVQQGLVVADEAGDGGRVVEVAGVVEMPGQGVAGVGEGQAEVELAGGVAAV